MTIHDFENMTDEEIVRVAQQDGDGAALEYLLNKYKNQVQRRHGDKEHGKVIKVAPLLDTVDDVPQHILPREKADNCFKTPKPHLYSYAPGACFVQKLQHEQIVGNGAPK